jgi:hypothetical protein
MTFSNINTSTPNSGLGDKLRDAFNIVNYNFSQIEDQVSLTQLNTILGSYSTITYTNSKDTILQNQINGLSASYSILSGSVSSLQTQVTSLGLLVDGKATITQLNNSVADINNTIAALQIVVDSKIDDAPRDGRTYGRQDENWVEVTGGGALPYKSYVALLSQRGTDDPTAIELYTDLGVNISYRYEDVGVYKIITNAPYFSKNKTIIFYTAYDRKEDAGYVIPVHFQWWNEALIYIYTDLDNELRNASIEIRVY